VIFFHSKEKESVQLGVKRISVSVAQHNILCPVRYSDALFISGYILDNFYKHTHSAFTVTGAFKWCSIK
jgi:hypothetical protein